MFMTFVLFAMLVMAIGKSDVQSLSLRLYGNDILGKTLYEHGSCLSKCHRKCRGNNPNKCQRCYAKCWLIKGYLIQDIYQSVIGNKDFMFIPY